LHPTTIRFGDRAYTAIARAADAQGISVSQYVREAALIRAVLDELDFSAEEAVHTAHDLLAVAREVRRLAEVDPPGPPRVNTDGRGASPRRGAGARSLAAASAATRKNPSPAPNSDRASTRTATFVAKRWRTIPATVSPAPPIKSGRRPNRSDDHPTMGRSASDAMAKEAKTIPTAIVSPARRSSTNRGVIGRMIPPAM